MAQPVVARFRRGAFGIKLEATYNVDPVLAAADLVLMRNVAYGGGPEMHRDERQTGLIAATPMIPGALATYITGEALLRGAGVAYSASVKPEVDAILRAWGFLAAGDFTVGLEKWTYTPRSGDPWGESATCALFAENAPQAKATGAYGTGSILLRAGEPGVMPVRFDGIYARPADVALITASPPTAVPPVFRDGAVTFDGVTTLRVASITLNIGNIVQRLPSASAGGATGAFHIADRLIGMSIDLEQVTAATYNFYQKWEEAALFATSWRLGLAGAPGQYKRFTFTAPKTQIVNITPGSRDGVRTYLIDCQLNPNVGADELTIVAD